MEEEATPVETGPTLAPPTALELQLFGDWICDGDTMWFPTPHYDGYYAGYHLNLTSSAYPASSNFRSYFAGGFYGPSQTPYTTDAWKEVDGSPSYTHHILVALVPATVIMSVTTNTLVLAQTDQTGNTRTLYFHK